MRCGIISLMVLVVTAATAVVRAGDLFQLNASSSTTTVNTGGSSLIGLENSPSPGNPI